MMHVFPKQQMASVYKHQQHISDGFTISFQTELKTFGNELFQAIFRERHLHVQAMFHNYREVRAAANDKT